MNTIVTGQSSLAHTIVRAFGVELDSEEFLIIYSQSISYLTKGISAFQFQYIIKPYCRGTGYSAKAFRLKLHESRYLCLNLKLFLLRMARLKSVTLDVVKELATELSIKVIDAKRMLQVWKQHPIFRRRMKAEARAIPRDQTYMLTEKGLNLFFSEIYGDVYKYIKFLAYKKLRFIAKSSNVELTDLHNDLLSKVVQAFYALVPIEKTQAHVINYLKRVAHNHAMNIIKTETSLKRGRLVNVGLDKDNARVFSLLMVSENQMALPEDGSDSSYDEIHGGTSNNLDKFELEFSVSEILNKLQVRSKKYRFLQILMGHEDAEFTAWLQVRKVAGKNEDNVDVQMKLSTADFNKLLSEFLNVAEAKVNSFISRLRRDLALPSVPSGVVRQPKKIGA